MILFERELQVEQVAETMESSTISVNYGTLTNEMFITRNRFD